MVGEVVECDAAKVMDSPVVDSSCRGGGLGIICTPLGVSTAMVWWLREGCKGDTCNILLSPGDGRCRGG